MNRDDIPRGVYDEKAGLREQVIVMVGGVPVTEEFHVMELIDHVTESA